MWPRSVATSSLSTIGDFWPQPPRLFALPLLPDCALLFRIHRAAWLAFERNCKLIVIAENDVYASEIRRVLVVVDLRSHALGRVV